MHGYYLHTRQERHSQEEVTPIDFIQSWLQPQSVDGQWSKLLKRGQSSSEIQSMVGSCIGLVKYALAFVPRLSPQTPGFEERAWG